MYTTITYHDLVAGANVAVEHNMGTGETKVKIANLEMLAQDWQQLKEGVDGLLTELARFNCPSDSP